MLAACQRWLHTHKDIPFLKRDALLKKYLDDHVDMEEGWALFHMYNSLVMSKGLLYMCIMPKGDTECVLAFLVPTGQHCTALHGVHHDARHQGQQRMLALMQEQFWWPMIIKECRALVQGCQHCRIFKGAVPKTPLCLIRADALLELIHIYFMSVELTMEINKPPIIKNMLVITDYFT